MEILTESSSISPRISFSYDLSLCDTVPVEEHPRCHFLSGSSSGLNSGFEFDLSATGKSFLNHESCSADELFSGGKIIPTEVKKKATPSSNSYPYSTTTEKGGVGGGEQEQRKDPQQCLAVPPHLRFQSGKSQSKEECEKPRNEASEDQKQTSNSKMSFWRFKRSSSLNGGNGYGRKLCPLQLLSRSNSTGSASGLPLTKETSSSSEKCHPPPPPLPPQPVPVPVPARLSNGYHQNQRQRPPLRRSGAASSTYGNSSMKVNTALNVHSGNLFGLGSVIFNVKDKNRRK
ncbi:hypothetical protein SAY86_014635 [Trapa natans]|uniref:Uncharacterized protein n=1 Tax=Trapa natans TaxID=22666 RepID=A0AAN7KG86_TRANT|nr:hypothetical protein SAY86_014635 [Trapa natans]